MDAWIHEGLHWVQLSCPSQEALPPSCPLLVRCRACQITAFLFS